MTAWKYSTWKTYSKVTAAGKCRIAFLVEVALQVQRIFRKVETCSSIRRSIQPVGMRYGFLLYHKIHKIKRLGLCIEIHGNALRSGTRCELPGFEAM